MGTAHETFSVSDQKRFLVRGDRGSQPTTDWPTVSALEETFKTSNASFNFSGVHCHGFIVVQSSFWLYPIFMCATGRFYSLISSLHTLSSRFIPSNLSPHTLLIPRDV